MNWKSPKFLVLVLAIASLGTLFWVAFNRGLLAPITTWAQMTTPITCPPDERLHVVPRTSPHKDKPISQLLPGNFDRSRVSILIEKSKYQLTLYYDQQPIKSYSVVFGDPQGDKRREGDRKTPEGLFKIRDLYPHPDWSKFLWLDYPTAQSQCKHAQSKQRGEIPFSSGIGGEIGIHGVPEGRDALVETRTNWTLGCPALKNKDVDEIYSVVQVGTVVEIIP